MCNNVKLLSWLISISSLPVLPLYAQISGQSTDVKNTEIQIDEKLERYHSVLLKRPESEQLFEKFQSSWLASQDEKSLADFLKRKASGEALSASKMLYAKYLTQRGNDLEALEVLNSAITKDSKDASLVLNRAKIYGRLLDFDKALLDIEKAIKSKSDDPVFSLKANKLKGRYLTKQGMAEEAIEHWNDLAKKNPDDQELIEDVIDILVGDGLLEPALVHAKKLRDNTRDPYRKSLRSLRIGAILQKQGDSDKAIQAYDETLKLSGTGSWLEREILAQVESLFRREENVAGLKKHLIKLYASYPQRIQIAQNLAQVHGELAEFKEAKKIYYDLIKRSPTNLELKKSLLSTLEKADDLEGAKKLLNSMIELKPKDPELHVQLAQVFVKLKNKESALLSLNEFVKKSDKKISTTLRHVSLLRSMGYDTEATKVYGTAVAANPEAPELLFKAAEFYIYLNKKEEAKAIWQTIAKSENSDVITKLLETLLLNGEQSSALKIVEAKLPKFKTQKSFLSASIKIAESNKKQELALKCASLTLQLVDNPIEIIAAINQLTRLNVKFKATDKSLKALEAKGISSSKDQFLLIALLEKNGNVERADKLLVQLSNSKEIPSLLVTAKIYESRFEQDKAAESLERIMRLPNGLKSSYLKQLTRLYQNSGDITKALETAVRWKKLTPNDKSAWMTEVQIHEEMGNTELALKALRRGTGRFEEDQDVLSRLAALYSVNNNFAQSKQLYWRLYDDVTSVTDKQRWISEIAKISLRDGKIDELVDELSIRRRNSPKSINPLMALAEVYLKQGKKEERRNLMLIASKLRPDDAELLLDIANGYQLDGDMDAYTALLMKAQVIDKSGRATKKLAKFYFDDNDYEKGMQELEKLSSGNGVNQKDVAKKLTDLEGLVMTLMKQEAFEEARNYLDTRIGEFPNHGRLLFLSAVIDYELGYIKRSFDTTKQLIAGNMKMDHIQSGWQFTDSKHGQSSPFVKTKTSQATKLMVASYQAVSHLAAIIPSANSANHYYRGRQNTVTTSPLPKNTEEMQFFAKLYAAKMIKDVSGEQKIRWVEELKSVGFTKVKFHQLLSDPKRGNKVMEYANSKIDDPFFLDLVIDSKFQSFSFKLSEVLYKKISENKDKLSSEYQALLPFCYTSDEQKTAIHKNLIKQLELESKAKITPLEISILLSHYRNSQEPSKAEPLSEKIILILQRFIQQYPDLEVQSITNKLYSQGYYRLNTEESAFFTADYAIKRNYILNKNYTKIAEMFNEASDGISKNYRANYSYGYSSGFGGRQNNSLTIEDAMTTITTVSNQQQSMLTAQDYTAQLSINIEKLYEQVELIKNPILKCIIAIQAKPEGDHSKLFSSAKESKLHLTDALTLEAYHKRLKASNYELASLINQAKDGSRDKTQRQSLDAILVSICSKKENSVKGTGKVKPFSTWEVELQDSVKSAARRLMLGKKITKAEEITNLLETFGMQKEKSRFLTKNNKSIRNATQGAVIGGIVGRTFNTTASSNTATNKTNLDPADKAAAMLIKGQKDNGVRLLASTLQKQLKDRNSSYQVKKTVEIIKKHKAEIEVLERFSPKGSISPRKWLAFYLAAETLGAEKEKKQALTRLKNLEIVPQSVRLPLALALTEENPERSISLLSSITDSSALFTGLGENLERKKRAAEDYNAVNKLDDSVITPYINSLKFLNVLLAKSDASLLVRDQYNFSNLYNNHRTFLVDFDARWKKLNAKKKGQYKKEFTTIFRQLDNFALTNKASSGSALNYLYKGCENEKELQSLEGKLLEQFKKQVSRLASTNSNQRSYPYRGYSNDTDRNLITKHGFFIQRMLKKKNADLLSNDLLVKLNPIEPELVSHIRFAKEHVLNNDNEILAKVVKLKSAKELEVFKLWDNLLSLRPAPKAEVEFTKILLNRRIADELKTKSNTNINGWGQNQEFLFINHRITKSYYLLRNAGEEKVIKSYLNHLAKADLKSKDDKKKEESWLSLLNNNQGTESLTYYALISTLIRHPSTVDLACESAIETEFPLYATGILSTNSFGGDDVDFDWDAERWIKELDEAQIITSKDKIKNRLMKNISSSEAKTLNGKYPNIWSLTYHSPSNDAKSTYSLVAHMIKGIEYYDNLPDNEKILADIIGKLEKIKGEKRLSAQILLTFTDSQGFATFIDANKKEILSSSPQVKAALVSIFDLNNNTNSISILKEKGIYDKLPLDTKKLDAGKEKEQLAFSQLEAPLNSSQLSDLDDRAVELIEKSIRTDVASACKTIDHYIHLVKNSPEAKNHYSSKNYLITPLEYALSEEIMDNLRKKKVYPKDLLKLIYHLYKREDSHELNVHEMLCHSMPINWHANHGLGKDTAEATRIILNETAETLNSIKDPDYLEFVKTAWVVFFCSDEYYQKLHLFKEEAWRTDVYELGKTDKGIEFLRMLVPIGTVHHNDYKYHRSGQAYNKRYSINNRLYFEAAYSTIADYFSGYPLKQRILIASAITKANQLTLKADYSKKLLTLLVDTYIEASEKLPDYAISYDLRHTCQVRVYKKKLAPGVIEKLALAGAKNLEYAVKSIQKGKLIHHYHFSNLVALCSMNKASVLKLKKLANTYSKDFIGSVVTAQALTAYGEIDAAYSVLPPRALMAAKIIPDRISHYKSMDKYTPLLIAKYTTPADKATISALMILQGDQISKDDTISTYNQRVGKTLDLALKAEPNFPRNSSLDSVVSVVMNNLSVEQTLKMKGYFDNQLKLQSSKAIADQSKSKERVLKSEMDDFQRAIRYAVATENIAFLQGHLKRSLKLKQIPTPANDNNKKKKKNNKAKKIPHVVDSNYAWYISDTIISSVNELFANPKNDQKVLRLLPIYRDAIKRRIQFRNFFKHSTGSINVYPYANLPAKYIHDELGETAKYNKFIASFSKKLLYKTGDPAFNFPVLFAMQSKYYGVTGIRWRLTDNEALLLRLINNQQYQKDVINKQQEGGTFDGLIDYGHYQDYAAIDLMKSGKIKIKEPAYAGVLAADNAHIQASWNLADKAKEQYASATKIFAESNAPSKLVSRYKLTQFIHMFHLGENNEAKMISDKIKPSDLSKAHKEALTDYIKLNAAKLKK